MSNENTISLYFDLLTQCQEAWQADRRDEALECLNVALSLIPDHFDAIAWCAVFAELQGDQELCIQSITKLAELVGEEQAAQLFAERINLLSDQGNPEEFSAAFIELSITPQDHNVELQGYLKTKKRIAQDVLSPLRLQLLMLEDHKGSRALIVSADLFAFDPEMVANVKKYSRLWRIPDTAVLLNASHTHYAPPTLKRILPSLGIYSDSFAEAVVNRIIRSLPLLRQNLEPVKIEIGHSQSSIALFRREHQLDGKVLLAQPNQNPDLSYGNIGLAKITWLHDQESLALVNYGCHPTEFEAIPFISSAYPGLLRSEVQQQLQLKGLMFLQGAAGDHKVGLLDNGVYRWPNSAQEALKSIVPLMEAVRTGLTQTLQPVQGSIQSAEVCLTAPLNTESEHAEDGILFLHRNQEFEKNPDLIQETLNLNLTVLEIGNWKLNAFNGEAVSDYARWFHKELDQSAFVLSYTNGNIAYIPNDQIIEEGGYEGHSSQAVYLHSGPFKVGLEQKIKLAFTSMWHMLAKNVSPAQLTSRQLDQSSKHRAFFVLSTGRSGTQTLAHLMEMAQNAVVWHHPEPNMIMETLYAYQQLIPGGETFWRGRSHILAHAWEQGKIHGETDHNMTPFALDIAKDIPHAKFLVLVRDPREFIRSGMRRGYYVAGGPWDDGRLKPLPEQAKKLNWTKMHPFEKVSWLWAETYRHINKAIEEIGKERVMIVRFEELIKGPKVAEDIFNFLELDGFKVEHAQKVLSQKLNAQRGGDFPHPRDWPPNLYDVSWHHCGDIAQAYGYPKVYGS